MSVTKCEAGSVELLRDVRGVYGIAGYDEIEGCEIILRPDKMSCSQRQPWWPRAVLQKITGGFRHSVFCNSTEESLRKIIHHAALNRAGLPWPPPHNCTEGDWWSFDAKQKARHRGVYHGLRLLSLRVINRLIDEAIGEAADMDAIRAARRFTFRGREKIYRAAAVSHRMLQLTEAFPVLALAISDERNLERHTAATSLVERGARLRDVAAVMGIPMDFRRIKPGVAHLVRTEMRPTLLRFMPDATSGARIWLQLVHWAHQNAGPDFAEWTARNVAKIPGKLNVVGGHLLDLADWVNACDERKQTPGRQFVVRPFVKGMSLKTVIELSADWHDAVADNMDGADGALPTPWFPAGKSGNYNIVPIETRAELYREGKALHHCVGTYAEAVCSGGVYIYSIRCDGERVATLSLRNEGDGASIEQVRGQCNAQPSSEIADAVRRWLRAQEKPSLPRPPGQQPLITVVGADPNIDEYDVVPF